MRFHALRHIPICALVLTLPLASAAAAQTGHLHLATHLLGDAPQLQGPEAGFTALFLKNPDGSSTQIYTLEFTPGSYVLSQVQSYYKNCYTEATNVAFTIVANQYTNVDVTMTPALCNVELYTRSDLGGLGQVTLLSPPNGGPVTCALHALASGVVTYVDHRQCHTSVRAGTTVYITSQAVHGSTVEPLGDTIHVDTVLIGPGATGLGRVFQGTADTQTFQPHQHPDLKIAYLGGTYGGEVLTGSYVLTLNGSDNARGVTVYPTLPDSAFQGAPNRVLTASRGTGCAANGTTAPGQCGLLEVFPGDSVFITLTESPSIPTIAGQTPYCSLIYANQPVLNGPDLFWLEADTTNNGQPCKPPDVQVTVSAGGSPPANQTVAKGSTKVPVLQFNLDPASTQTLNDITLSSQGTGNEALDITKVSLLLDRNGNGVADAGDSVLATGTYAANDGTVTLSLSPVLQITGPTNFLVTYDFNVTLADRFGGGMLVALFPLLFFPAARRRRGRWIGFAGVILTGAALASCSGGSTPSGPPAATSTYTATLTAATISGVAKTNLGIQGATITIDK